MKATRALKPPKLNLAGYPQFLKLLLMRQYVWWWSMTPEQQDAEAKSISDLIDAGR